MTVSLPNRVDSAHIETRYRVDRDCAGLDDTPASTTDRDFLLAHLGRDVLHGSVTRDFKKAYRRNKTADVPCAQCAMNRTVADRMGNLKNIQFRDVAAVCEGKVRGHNVVLSTVCTEWCL